MRKVKDFVQHRLGIIPVFLTVLYNLDGKLTSCLTEMCSSIKVRLLCSRPINPETFKHITLHVDGHDSRVAYRNADKSGFRTQVCCDMDSMMVFASQPAECHDFDDGTMLSKVAIDQKIHHLDCLALDGGYTLHLEGIIAASDTLTSIELSEEEKVRYDAVFSSLRSKIEGFFSDMQTTFAKFSYTLMNRVADRSVFSLQYKLCFLLCDIKRMVALCNISTEPHHSHWVQDDFDYPD
ncbi:hypothetical protein BGX21_002029 [Mortierella sp. AD011]|nr:hypothetical protein BGX21_002029 [Mortierella sp. AD011]